jgi:hypothetical protein
LAEGLTTAPDLKKLSVIDLHGQGVQTVLTLKMTYVPNSQTSYKLSQRLLKKLQQMKCITKYPVLSLNQFLSR